MPSINLGNIVGLLKSETAPAKKYVIWAKILNPSFPDIVELRYWDDIAGAWIPVTDSTTNYWVKPVITQAIATPPPAPLEGDRYLIPTGATGVWSGKTDQIATYKASTWQYTTPLDGYIMSIRDEANKLYDYRGVYGVGGDWFVNDFQVPIAPGTYIPSTEKAVALGVATLDVGTKVPAAQINGATLPYAPTNVGDWTPGMALVGAALDELRTLVAGVGGVTEFTSLSDAPSSYTGQTLKGIRVNAAETGLEFYTTGGGGGGWPLTGPAALTGDVNITGGGLYGLTLGDDGADNFLYLNIYTDAASEFYFGGDFNLFLNANGIINDQSATPKGLVYNADYSANYTDRSLADWGNVWRGFGTTTLTGNAEIIGSDAHSIEFTGLLDFDVIAGSTYPFAEFTVSSTVGVNFQYNINATDAVGMTVSATLFRLFDGRAVPAGIEYMADYSAGYSARSLIDKDYADTTYWRLADESTLTDNVIIALAGFPLSFTGYGNILADILGAPGFNTIDLTSKDDTDPFVTARLYLGSGDIASMTFASGTPGPVTAVVLGGSTAELQHANATSEFTRITIGEGIIEITSAVAGFAGLQENTDYSANYTGLSLINKDYADATYEPIGGGGGITRSIITITASDTLDSAALTDYVYHASGSFPLTLPTAVGNTNRYTIKNEGTGIITMDTTSSETIDDEFTVPIPAGDSLDLVSNGTNWRII
jgi:hypothetical protein